MVARSRDEFARRAAALWEADDDPGDVDVRLRWYREHFDPHALDRRLLELVVG